MTKLPDPLTRTLFFCAIAAACCNVLIGIADIPATAEIVQYVSFSARVIGAGLLTAVAYLSKPPDPPTPA